MSVAVKRYHDISCGHRVLDHEGACARLHGHNYRFHFTVQSTRGLTELDRVGRVVDFSVIKGLLCRWLDENWDHRFLVYALDPWAATLSKLDETVVQLTFNPTAENLASYLVGYVGPKILPFDLRLVEVTVEETRKCSAVVWQTWEDEQ